MAKLMYRDPGSGQHVLVDLLDGNLGPIGPQGAVPSPVGSISSDAGNIATLSNGAVFVPVAADSGLPTGAVVAYGGSVAPNGWHPCDGTPHGSAALEALMGTPNSPDLRDKFVRGAGSMAPGVVGGADSMIIAPGNMPSHDHGAVSGPNSVDHTHTGTSGTMSANAAHAHSASTGYVSADHTHWVPDHGSGLISQSHLHTVFLNDGNGESGDGNYIDSNPNNTANQKVTGNTDWTPHNHGHGETGFGSGWISANHAHVTTVNATDVNHTHNLTSGGASVGHTHTVTVQGGGQAVATIPGHIVLCYIVKK